MGHFQRSIEYQPALDGIRAVAVALVFLYHCHVPGVAAGFLGVHMFFALSGFLITRLLLATPGITSPREYLAFTLRRLGRLYPALVVAVAFAGLLWTRAGAKVPFGEAAWPGLFYYANWVVAERGFRAMDPLGPLWSLAVEGQFYLVWPWFLKAHGRLSRRGLAIALGLWTVGLGIVVYDGHLDHALWARHVTTPACLGVLLVGGIGGLLPLETLGSKALWRFLGAAALFSIGGACALGPMPVATVWLAGGYVAVGLATVAWIFAVLREPSAPIARLCRLGPLVWLGQLSYGVYLFHFPIIRATQSLSAQWGMGALLLLRVTLTVLLAWLCFRYVERPLRRLVRAWANAVAGVPVTR